MTARRLATTPPADTVPEATLRTRYEALRADWLERARFNAQRALATSGLMLALAAVLSAIHWRWLRTKSDSDEMAGTAAAA